MSALGKCCELAFLCQNISWKSQLWILMSNYEMYISFELSSDLGVLQCLQWDGSAACQLGLWTYCLQNLFTESSPEEMSFWSVCDYSRCEWVASELCLATVSGSCYPYREWAASPSHPNTWENKTLRVR